MNKTIVPVILGADLNCYNLARAFHEKYGVKSYAFGRYAIAPTKYSTIIHFTIVPDIDKDEVMLDTLHRFADAHIGDRMLLFGCTDDYAAMIIRNREELSDFITPYPPEHLLSSIAKKAEFYETCDKFGIPYPKTVVLDKASDDYSAEKLGFPYPIIVKPSSSVDYWKFPFDGMKKVYVSNSPEETKKIVDEIYAAGYPDRMILQEFIPGGDSYMRVFTTFSDQRGKVRAMCLGHTMLEEHTPKGLGNHAAILTEPVSTLPIAEKIKAMLESLGYTGYANFDIKCGDDPDSANPTDFRLFEINLRHGRSNYYVTAGGINIAQLACEVYESEGDDCVCCENEVFWHLIPKSVAYAYTDDEALVEKAKALTKAGREASSLWYPADMLKSPLRLICVLEQLRRQKKKYKTYCKKYR